MNTIIEKIALNERIINIGSILSGSVQVCTFSNVISCGVDPIEGTLSVVHFGVNSPLEARIVRMAKESEKIVVDMFNIIFFLLFIFSLSDEDKISSFPF